MKLENHLLGCCFWWGSVLFFPSLLLTSESVVVQGSRGLAGVTFERPHSGPAGLGLAALSAGLASFLFPTWASVKWTQRLSQWHNSAWPFYWRCFLCEGLSSLCSVRLCAPWCSAKNWRWPVSISQVANSDAQSTRSSWIFGVIHVHKLNTSKVMTRKYLSLHSISF